MRVAMLVIVSWIFSASALAQSQKDLSTIMSGWAQGKYKPLATYVFNRETKKWDVEGTLAEWDVELLRNPLGGRFFGGSGDNGQPFEFFVVLGDKTYTTYSTDPSKGQGPDSGGVVNQLLEAHVFAPDNWTVLVAWKKRSAEEPQRYAEMAVAGGIFYRTDFIDDPETGLRKRVAYAVAKRIE